jgi:hypothetical protein
MVILGINCTTSAAFLAVCVDAAIADGYTERLKPPAGLEAGESLIEFAEAVRRVLREVQPERVILLMPETWTASYKSHLERASMETLVRLVCAQEHLPVDQLSRAAARSRLGLGRSGALDAHLSAAGDPVGQYWTTGRGVAALAALAGEAGR